MTRKDYILIAAALRLARVETPLGEGYALSAFDSAYHNLAQALKDENPRFNQAKFYLAVYSAKERCSRIMKRNRQE